VVARDAEGKILFLLPLSTRSVAFARQLEWLGSDLCDYNAPLLAGDFYQQIDQTRFMLLWRDILQRLQSHSSLGYDLIHLEKMPAMVGAQSNVMLGLRVMLNPSGAYLIHLSANWKEFYETKRSSATRRRERTKLKRLSESGEVRLVNPNSENDLLCTINTLMEQKACWFALNGITNLFARPGYPEFYRALATDEATKHLVYVSRLDVGSTVAAVNIGLTFRGCYYHVLASYNGELSRFGPGAAHLRELMRQASERGFRIFDFTIGDEPYKLEWCDTQLKLYDYFSIATLRGALIVLPSRAVRRLKRWIKQTPMLWNAFSKGRKLIRSCAIGFRD
jgi:CelD/BcsL family acetyltransferase involved in cellulose biosynthesis